MTATDEFDFTGSFINEENTTDGDILTIIATPQKEEKTSPTQIMIVNGVIKPKKYEVLNILVEKDGSSKTYTPDNSTGMRFVRAWGLKFTGWVGKQFRAKQETYKSYGVDKIRIAGFPLESEKVIAA